MRAGRLRALVGEEVDLSDWSCDLTAKMRSVDVIVDVEALDISRDDWAFARAPKDIVDSMA